MAGRKKTPSFDSGGWNIDWAEPYMEPDGSIGVALIDGYEGRRVGLRSIREWVEVNEGLGRALEDKFAPVKILWPLPGKPEMVEEDGALHRDLMRCNDQYVEFSNDLLPSVFATWQIATYLEPFLDRSPLLQIYGPPESGKGQALDQVHKIAYRGFKISRPTAPVLYRLSEWYRTTVAMDEIQDLDRDSWMAVLNILKCTFDGTPIARCNHDNTDLDVFRTRAFMAVSYKNKLPPDDVQGRSVHIPMRLNGERRELVPFDSEEHADLRARLLALRLKLLTDGDLVATHRAKLDRAADPNTLGLDGRGRDITRALLLPGLLFDEGEAIVETIRESSQRARDASRDTFEAQIQYALQEIWGSNGSKVYVPTVRDAVVHNMAEQGDLKGREEIETRRVTNALKVLNYELARGAHNASYIDKLSNANKRAYDANCRRFPRAEKDE